MQKPLIHSLWTLKFTLIVLAIIVIGGFMCFYAIANAQLIKDEKIKLAPQTKGDFIYKEIAPTLEKTQKIAEYNQNEEIIKRLDRIIYLLEK